MKLMEKHPLVMIIIGIAGISLSAIFVKYSQAPSVVTALYRLMWTVALMTPVVLGRKDCRRELRETDRKTVLLCGASGVFLALHFTAWFESLNQTSVASSTAIVCTEVIWVALGYCLFMKGKISVPAGVSILVTVGGSLLIAFSDYSAGGNHLYGDVLALAAAVFCAVYTLIGRQARGYMSTTISGLAFTGYGVRSVVVGLLLSVCSTLLGHSIFSWCLKFFSPSFVSASKLCEPVAAAVFALFLFREVPALLQIAGGVVTIGGVLLYSQVEKKENDVLKGK